MAISKNPNNVAELLTKPEVELLGMTRPLEGGSPQVHIERAARECYQSHDKMTPESNLRFLRGIILRGHESVLEHASATFRVHGGSRAFTHEMVRHRLLSFSQQSQRYVSETNYRAILPPAIAANPDSARIFTEHLEQSRVAYRKLKELGLKNEDARFVLPNAVESGIVISGNFREWRHVFRMRCAAPAQWEIRRICGLMLKLLQAEAPAVFGDLLLDEETWIAAHISETAGCRDAQDTVNAALAGLKDKGDTPEKILMGLGDDALYRALSHLVRCLNPDCRSMRAMCGDWK